MKRAMRWMSQQAGETPPQRALYLYLHALAEKVVEGLTNALTLRPRHPV